MATESTERHGKIKTLAAEGHGNQDYFKVTVIPAKAGIQSIRLPKALRNSYSLISRHGVVLQIIFYHWIPAGACPREGGGGNDARWESLLFRVILCASVAVLWCA